MIQVMEDYDLTKEDWDSIIEVGQFEGQRDPIASIPSKVCTCINSYSLQSMSRVTGIFLFYFIFIYLFFLNLQRVFKFMTVLVIGCEIQNPGWNVVSFSKI